MLYLFIILAMIVLAYLFLCWRIYRYVFYTPTSTQNDDLAFPQTPETLAHYEDYLQDIRELNAKPCEDMYIISRDGLKLHGRYYAGQSDAPLLICLHGYRGTPSRNFCGGPPFLFRAGYNILMLESRGHGKSEGHTVTFGIKEQYDCCDWVKFAAEHFGPERKIILMGLSMGAATILMAAGTELPSNVCGIVADSPYTDPLGILLNSCAKMHYPAWASAFFLSSAAFLFGHFSLNADADAEKAAGRTNLPILLIHGAKDAFVPPRMSEAISAANPKCIRRETFEDAGHGMSYIVDAERYERIICSFADECAQMK